MANKSFSPERDASLGLIFRLNDLWAKVDHPAEAGNYEKWDTILDRIYCNLLFRNDIVVEFDEKTKEIRNIGLSKEDTKIYDFLSKKIMKWKRLYNLHKNKNTKTKKGTPYKIVAKSNWYHAVQLKDIWLRKFMQELGLYLKEVENSPGSSMFGSFGNKKK